MCACVRMCVTRQTVTNAYASIEYIMSERYALVTTIPRTEDVCVLIVMEFTSDECVQTSYQLNAR